MSTTQGRPTRWGWAVLALALATGLVVAACSQAREAFAVRSAVGTWRCESGSDDQFWTITVKDNGQLKFVLDLGTGGEHGEVGKDVTRLDATWKIEDGDLTVRGEDLERPIEVPGFEGLTADSTTLRARGTEMTTSGIDEVEARVDVVSPSKFTIMHAAPEPGDLPWTCVKR